MLSAMLAALLLALALVACGGGDDSDSTSGGASAKSDSAGGREGGSEGDGGQSGNGSGGSGSGEGGSGSGSSEGGSGSGGGGSGSGNGSGGGSGSGNKKSGGGKGGGGSATRHNDSGGGSGQFRSEAGDSGIPGFGSEVGAPEFNEAAAALHGYLDARAERDWGGACRYLAESLQESTVQFEDRTRTVGCGTTLNEIYKDTATSKLREEAEVDVGSLRAEGSRGFLLYRSPPGGSGYTISVLKEGGEWKVGSLSGTPLG